MADRIENLTDFVAFVAENIRGSEKSEAQTFLNSFFQSFGYGGAVAAGARYEEGIKNTSKTGNKGFADLIWDGRILIEMKSRGVDLRDRKIWTQASLYWSGLPKDKRSQYVMLCNFDEFHIYDFDNQHDEPVDIIRLEELPKCEAAFSFMRGNKTPLFRNNQKEITEDAAERLGNLYNILIARGSDLKWREYSEVQAQRFVLQCVLAMFAEDLNLLPDQLFTRCVKDCIEQKISSYDLLGGLFKAMNQREGTPSGRYKDVKYFNGGLFKEIHPIELEIGELIALESAANADWTKVRPSIFGNIFEGAYENKQDKKKKSKPSKGSDLRHKHGIHFTSEGDINKIVLPTITNYWRDRIEAAKTLSQLQSLHQELSAYKILDPACGSGNFLYMAYQDLKKVEFNLLQRMQGLDPTRGYMSLVTPQQFFGMDINSFAVELAKVTLMIGRSVAIRKLNLPEPSLPLHTLDQNIICADALFTDWVKADAIIGNPPFLGGKRMRLNLGDDYIDRVFAKFPDVKDSVDFCSYWFRIAHDNLDENGRAGLVATNSISQGKSRAASLDYIAQNGGYIHNAVSTQKWSGEAKVHVSIANWCKIQPDIYRLDEKEVARINTSLQAEIDVTHAVRLKANLNIGFQGVIPIGKGFYVDSAKVEEWIKADPKNKDVLKLSCSAGDLTDIPNGLPSRWIIDFNDMSFEEAITYKLPFKHLELTVQAERKSNRRDVTRINWWKYGEKRPLMRESLASLSCYFIAPSHSTWFIFLPAQSDWLPNNSITVITSDDFYVLGILTSKVHRLWVKAQSSTLKGDTRYTHNSCFETFPFPQLDPNTSIKEKQAFEKIRATMQELHQYRSKEMESKQWGITKLYKKYFNQEGCDLYKLHAKLDKLVMQAYGFSEDDDILSKLLELNLQLAEREKQGLPVIGARHKY
jgi:SAM-dependent methyltransferase